MPRTVNIATVIDQPSQRSTRGLQILCREPGAQVRVYYLSVPNHGRDRGLRAADLIGCRSSRRIQLGIA